MLLQAVKFGTSSPNVITVILSKVINFVWYVAFMNDEKLSNKTLTGRPRLE
jgi:hypothetical protein